MRDPRRKQGLEKIAEKKPNTLYFDVNICVYKGFAAYAHGKAIGFVRIDSMAVVVAGARSMAMEWMSSLPILGSILVLEPLFGGG